MACCTSIAVLVSSIYSMTFVFTKSIVKEMILDHKDIQLNIRYSSKDLILDYDMPTGITIVDAVKDDLVSSSSSAITKPVKKTNNLRKGKEERADKKPTDQIRKDKKQTNKYKLRLGDKKKKQVWIEESNDIGEITSSDNPLNDTTIIIATNWMPSTPSTDQLDKVVTSLSRIHGLAKDAPMIIAVDGAYENGARYESKMNVDNRAYVKAIQAKYDQPHITILAADTKIMLTGNMKRALRKVQTEYVLVLQHDLPFINEVNHTALVETMEAHSEVRLVRFPTARVLTRTRDRGVCDENEVDFEDSNNGIHLTKTHVWSDRYVLLLLS